MARDENMIAALQRERAGYETRGLTDRVRQVDEQLAHYGDKRQAVGDDGPQGRTAADPKQQTADGDGPQPAPPAKKAAAKKAAPPAQAKPQE